MLLILEGILDQEIREWDLTVVDLKVYNKSKTLRELKYIKGHFIIAILDVCFLHFPLLLANCYFQDLLPTSAFRAQ